MRIWYARNKIKISENRKIRYKIDEMYRNKHKLNALLYRQKYPAKRAEQNKKWNIFNHKKKSEYNKKYYKTHPEEYLKSNIKHHNKYGKIFNLNNHEFKWALQSWSNTIKKRDNYKCQICGKYSNHAHHILYKSVFPELALNINNGISLCIGHHKEIHGRKS